MTAPPSDIWNKYGPTAARSHLDWDRAQFADLPRIDIHGHASAAAALAYLEEKPIQPPKGPGLSPLADAVNQLHHEQTSVLLTEPSARLERLDEMGIDVQVLWPTPHLHSYYGYDPDIAVHAAKLTNDGMAAFAAAHPRRFIPMGTVPMQCPEESVRELERCAGELGIRGVQILGTIGGAEISDPAFDAFWAAAEALNMLVFVHGSGNSLGGRLRRHNFVNAIGNPLETTIALSFLISDGVLEKYPKLRILAAHGGGYLGGYPGRGDHNWGARADGFNGLPHPPSFYLKRNVWFDSVVFTREQLEHLVKLYGAEHVAIGTDFPFNMGEFEPMEHLLTCERLNEQEKRKVAGGTAKALLGL